MMLFIEMEVMVELFATHDWSLRQFGLALAGTAVAFLLIVAIGVALSAYLESRSRAIDVLAQRIGDRFRWLPRLLDKLTGFKENGKP